MCSFALLLRVFRSLLNLFGASSDGLGSSLDGLCVSLRYLRTSFGALGAYLEISWSVFESSWGLFWGSWMRLGSSSGALENVFGLGKPLFSKMSVSYQREHDFRNLYEQEREASYRGSVFFRLG